VANKKNPVPKTYDFLFLFFCLYKEDLFLSKPLDSSKPDAAAEVLEPIKDALNVGTEETKLIALRILEQIISETNIHQSKISLLKNLRQFFYFSLFFFDIIPQ
jgi:hypothetical protein